MKFISAKIYKLLLKINLKLNIIMATIQELEATVDALQVSIDTKQEQIAAAIAAFEATIEDLRNQLANGGTPEQLQAIVDKLVVAKADLEGTPTE